MQYKIKIIDPIEDYIEAVNYDYYSLIDLIVLVLSKNKAEQLNLVELENKLLAKYAEYRCLTQEVLNIYKVPANVYSWKINFVDSELSVKVSSVSGKDN